MLSSTRTQALAAVYCHWSQVGGFPDAAWVRRTAVAKGPCVKLHGVSPNQNGVGPLTCLLPAGAGLSYASQALV